VNVVFYDSRNPSTNDSAECYVARSVDGGVTFANMKVSDHRFQPKPISGLAGGYQGDYIGIAFSNNKLYPFWADDYSGVYQVWTAGIDLGPAISSVPLGNTEQTTGTRTVNCVITPAGSGINPSLTKLYYSKDNPSISNSINLTNTSGNNWTAALPLSGAGLYRYYLTTTDSISRTATDPGGAPANFYQFTASADTIPPVITHTPIGNTPRSYWPITLSAVVTDNIGVDSVWVEWYKNTPSPIKRFKLNNTGGNNYSAQFNSTQAEVIIGDHIYYVIKARDNSSNHNQTQLPSTGYYSFTLTTLRLGEGFWLSAFPPVGWSISGPGASYWSQGTVSSYGVGQNSARFNYYNATVGNNAALTTLQFDPTTNATDSLKVDIAHAYYGATYIDSLRIESSTNGGTTFSPIIVLYASTDFGGYYSLSTVSQTGIFTPTASQWKTRKFGMPIGTNQVRFNAITGYGNDLFLDSIIIVSPATGMQNQSGLIPIQYALYQNFPNPFNPVTKINFDIPKQGLVNLKIYDVLGREIKTLVKDIKAPGSYSIEFNASEFSSGVYFYRLESNGFTDVKKMMMIK
ncbi:T9SS C-terminal target domain-containing protein, partial [bacterium]